MLEKIKGFFKSVRKKVGVALIGVCATSLLAVSAFAADSTESGSNMAGIVNSAGASLSTEFSNLVTALVPVLIGIAMVGLGLYAVIYLFKMAKKFFAQAAG